MTIPTKILDDAVATATKLGTTSAIEDDVVRSRIDYVCRCLSNRAGARLLMSCMLAKIAEPRVDPRQPFTKIGGEESFSGRTYDEQFLTSFINTNRLPCNSTTAFLTPALRNHDAPLTTTTTLVGRPPQVYRDTLQLLDDVAQGRVAAMDVLTEAVRALILIRDEKQSRIRGLVEALSHGDDALPLPTEGIVNLLRQHLACKHSSRLPVLIVASAYKAAAENLNEVARTLLGHLSADEQSGAAGDIEVCLVNDDRVVTAYEMKSKRVTVDDIDRALQKIVSRDSRIDNYIFVTTDVVEDEVRKYAESMYDQTGGTEIALLDCLGFIRHFLHLFHRLRIDFLDMYQALLLSEPDSAVNQPLKEAFLTLRQAAESDE